MDSSCYAKENVITTILEILDCRSHSSTAPSSTLIPTTLNWHPMTVHRNLGTWTPCVAAPVNTAGPLCCGAATAVLLLEPRKPEDIATVEAEAADDNANGGAAEVSTNGGADDNANGGA
jgi:hypothetical protein